MRPDILCVDILSHAENRIFQDRTFSTVSLHKESILVIITLRMIILGIETSCDETSAAVVQDGSLLSNATAMQLFHSEHGGVVPELASRAHQRLIVPIVEDALRKASIEKKDLDAVAAVYGPGLIGSILVGLSFGKAMAMGLDIPFIGVNHMEAHIFSNMIEEPKPVFPYVNLTVSGGHTQLVLVKDYFQCELLGETMDDAAGEAFDKVAKMLGVGYPGGPLVDKFAAKGNAKAVKFPRPYLEEGSHQFSFSGLKTSVLYYLRNVGFDRTAKMNEQFVADVCASFQAAVVDVLIDKLLTAAKKYNVKDIALCGGVSANSELRRRLAAEAAIQHLRLFIPKLEYCTDNGAMVAQAGYERLRAGHRSNLELTAEPNLQLNDHG
jgi:N6-L-threonylcarbamoyladenine synthase